MTTHLVTGAAGLIGSHLVDRLLLDPKNQVTALDDLSTGRTKNLWTSNANLGLKIQCVTDHIYGQYDFIWHLACPASPPAYQLDPIKTITTCYRGTENVLKKANKDGSRLLIASTSEIYGDPLEHPQQESYFGNVNTLGPRACYDEGKRISETLAYNYWLSNNVDVKLVRIFNTYGPRMSVNDGRVISNFICQSLTNQPHTIYGDGSTTRSFCFVLDTVEALIRVMASKGSLVYNVGNPAEITIKQLSDTIHKQLNKTPSVNYKEQPTDDPVRRKPDISKIYADLNWSPQIQLEEGLKESIFYFKNVL